MKKCLWCAKDEGTEEGQVTFKKEAHIFPQSLGGKLITPFVCDRCNHYFGSRQNPHEPSVEVALKEPLFISQFYLRLNMKSKRHVRFKSEYFDYNAKQGVISPKLKYRLLQDFQTKFVRQFKRGVYKVFLEQRSIDRQDAYDAKYDFIRHFARYGVGDLPVFYLTPSFPAVMISSDDFDPVLRFTDYSDEEMAKYGFYSYRFIAHEFAFPVIRSFELTYPEYAKHRVNDPEGLVAGIKPIREVSDIDFLFKYAF